MVHNDSKNYTTSIGRQYCNIVRKCVFKEKLFEHIEKNVRTEQPTTVKCYNTVNIE